MTWEICPKCEHVQDNETPGEICPECGDGFIMMMPASLLAAVAKSYAVRKQEIHAERYMALALKLARLSAIQECLAAVRGHYETFHEGLDPHLAFRCLTETLEEMMKGDETDD